MNHSVKSKTIRHDCHLLVRAERHHLQTLVFLLQLFKSNSRELEAIQGDEPLSLRSVKIIAQNELLIPPPLPSRGSSPGAATAMRSTAAVTTHRPTWGRSQPPLSPHLLLTTLFPRCHFGQRRTYLCSEQIKQSLARGANCPAKF